MALSEGWCDNPSVLTAKSLVNKKGGCIASKTQQSDSLCLAVNPPPFDKGGKCGGAERGDGCAYEKVVGMERLVGDPSVLRQIGLSEY